MEPDSTREVFRGHLIDVRVEGWNGHRYEVVHHPGAAAVVPLLPDGRVVLVRQMRHAIRDSLVEIPAGILDRPDEDALSTAARELREETGYRHRSIGFLGGIYTSAGFSDEYIHLFVADTDPEPEGMPEPGIQLLIRPLEEMARAARAGRVRDAKTAVALLLAEGRRAEGLGLG
jgi:ADP-ribose pyrophosphatase